MSHKLPIGMVELAGWRCRCGHEWLRVADETYPVRCPHCKSARWDKPYGRVANSQGTDAG